MTTPEQARERLERLLNGMTVGLAGRAATSLHIGQADATSLRLALSSITSLRAEAEALKAERDEYGEIGERDGYEAAVQAIDLMTGGDGEYRFCTNGDPDRHTPDPEHMKRRIAERFRAAESKAEALEGEVARLKARAQEIWTERGQILHDAGADEFDLIKRTEAERARNLALLADRERLVEAAEPFGRVGDLIGNEDLWPDNEPVCDRHGLTLQGVTASTFRRLRTVLTSISEGGGDACPNPNGCEYCREFGCPRAIAPPPATPEAE